MAASIDSEVEGAFPEEGRYRSLFELAPDVIYGIDADGTFSDLNPAFERVTGWSVEEWLGRPFVEIVHPDDAASAADYFRRELTAPERAPHELRVRARTGEYLIGEFQGMPRLDGDGRVVGIIGIARDVTRQRHVETERTQLLAAEQDARLRVEAAQRRVEFLAEASNILAGSLDFEATLGNVATLAVSYLADWCTITLLEEDGSLRRIALTHLQPEKLDLVRELEERYPPNSNSEQRTRELLDTGESWLVETVTDDMLLAAATDDEHLRLLRQLGLRSSMVVPLDARGRILGTIAFISGESRRAYNSEDLALAEDLGRRAGLAVDNARLFRQAQDALRLRDEFLSIASHELKTPLTSLQLQIQLLERHVRRGRPIEGSVISALERQVGRLTRLIDDLLDVSRISSGRLTLERQKTDLVAATRDVLDRFEEQITRSGSSVVVDAPDPVVGFWDRFRLDQVITNLLSNAIKYGRGRPIAIQITGDATSARFTIRDEGIGIHPAELPRIFDRFERVAASGHYSGLGLGLYIARQIVDAKGGTISVTSEPDRGSTFTVSLPLYPPE